ncbi:MAG: class I SAM-dependent rRNA methyltransferase [Candidatus Omnitrophota bacterium]
MKTIRCILKAGKEKPLEGHHPWVFSGAIDRIDEDYATGDLVKVYSAQDRFLGIGYLNPRSQIAIRMLVFQDIPVDEHFFAKRVRRAIDLRYPFLPPDTNAYRLVHSEGDFLPGLIVDRYADYLVVQFQTAGIEKWRDVIIRTLGEALGPKGIYEKNDTDHRETEGLEKRSGVLAGEEPPNYVEIKEYGIKFAVDLKSGQKTGFFLDQRENRKKVGMASAQKRVLNCFAYTGGFGVVAAKWGASETVSVEASEAALNTARTNYELNGLTGPAFQFVKADVFEYLRSVRQEFDVVVLDPPAFCKHKAQVMQASRGYKDINLSALRLLAKGGLLFTYSCSSHIDPDLFQKIVFGAAKDTHKKVRILEKTSHGFDHPINIYHPEGEYLKGLVCQVF